MTVYIYFPLALMCGIGLGDLAMKGYRWPLYVVIGSVFLAFFMIGYALLR